MLLNKKQFLKLVSKSEGFESIGSLQLNHLQKVQNRAARIITSSRYDAPNKMLIKQLGWKKIEEMIQYQSRVMVYKSVNGLAPQYLQDTFI